MTSIKYALTRDVKHPNRGTAEAAGIDFFIPFNRGEFFNDFLRKNDAVDLAYKLDTDGELLITIKPGSRVLIPSGVRLAFDKGTALIAANKSGVSSKKGLVFTAQVVDSDYDGEIHIGVANVSSIPATIKTGDKLIQFVHTPVLLTPLAETTPDDITHEHELSTRGAKGFGEGTGNN